MPKDINDVDVGAIPLELEGASPTPEQRNVLQEILQAAEKRRQNNSATLSSHTQPVIDTDTGPRR